MTGVMWVELPPDAPEPPPLSVVRDNDTDEWVRLDKGWHLLGVTNPQPCTWADIRKAGPLLLGQPEGALWPLVESVEPSPYEVRHAALTAAVELYYGERDDPAEVIGAARVFEGYLRVGDGDEVLVTAEEWERFKAFTDAGLGARPDPR